jgi:hypothetical protein
MGSGEALPLLPDSKGSASEKWMRHYIWSGDGDFGCPICWVAETAEESQFCAKGKELREAAYSAGNFTIPRPEKKPTSTIFNLSIEGHR